jgi:translation elongation factor EF-Ts
MTVGEMVSQLIHKLGENISIRRYARFKVGESAGAPAEESPSAVAAS